MYEELFFKSIHFYGLSDEFEDADYISQFPIEFRQKYDQKEHECN
jgi:hypothetical protein